MSALAGPYLIVCATLCLAGLAKIVTPEPTQTALRSLRVDVPSVAVRVLGAAEVAVGVAAIIKGGEILPIIVGMAYLAFAVIVFLLIRAETASSCGCFGKSSTPPSVLHVIVNVVAAGVAFASTGMDDLRTTLDDQAGSGFPLVLLVVVGTYALYLLLTALPAALNPPKPAVRDFSLTETGTQLQ